MGDSSSVSEKKSFIRKIKNIAFTSDRFRMGDLYGMSFLSKFRKRTEKFVVFKKSNKKAESDLYIYGDSFAADKNYNNAFDNIRNVYFIDKRFTSDLINPADPNINNIFINETTERNLYPVKISQNNNKTPLGQKYFSTGLWQKIEEKIFHPLVEQNLEMLLFDYEFLSKIKELKADLIFNLFNKTDKQVSIAKNHKRLYLELTTNEKKVTSSTYPLNDKEINTMIFDLNHYETEVYKHGYDDYYLTIVPNSITVNEFNTFPYNNKILRIERSKMLKSKCINVLYPFLKANVDVYMNNDAHWNNKGFNVWIERINAEIGK